MHGITSMIETHFVEMVAVRLLMDDRQFCGRQGKQEK